MFFYLLVYRKKCFIFHFMYFLKFLFKKKNKKEDYFTLFYMTVTPLLSPLQLIVGTSNSLKKRAKVFVMNLNTEKKILNKYYTRECISLFDGVESIVNVRFQVEKCGIRLRLLPLNITLPFVNTVVNTYP